MVPMAQVGPRQQQGTQEAFAILHKVEGVAAGDT